MSSEDVQTRTRIIPLECAKNNSILYQVYCFMYLQRCPVMFQHQVRYTSVVRIQMSSVLQMSYSMGNLTMSSLRYVIMLASGEVGF